MLSNSWMITRKRDGRVMFETDSKTIAASVKDEKYLVEPAHEYLARINREIRNSNPAHTA